jgi:hypothetical protein
MSPNWAVLIVAARTDTRDYSAMPRTARASVGGICYHVINRGNGRSQVFHTQSDYRDFVGLMQRSSSRTPMRVLSFCLMPNHFHFVVGPYNDGDISRWINGDILLFGPKAQKVECPQPSVIVIID